MSMFNDIDWTRKRNDEICIWNSEEVKTYAKKFSQGHWTFLGPGDEKKWYGKPKYPPEAKWNSVASQMAQRFKETGHAPRLAPGNSLAGKHSSLRIIVRDYSIHKGFRTRIVLVPGTGWYELQDQT